MKMEGNSFTLGKEKENGKNFNQNAIRPRCG